VKVQVTLTNDEGIVYVGEVDLKASSSKHESPKKRSDATKGLLDSADMNFDLPLRPFIKKYSASMSGPKRLTLLVAWLAKGKSDVQVGRVEVSRAWNKMKTLMGGPFNSAYETRARDNGWLDSPKPGVYTLLSSWQEVL
jgi:hypothetical protein